LRVLVRTRVFTILLRILRCWPWRCRLAA
jgi:hypothetical protein